MPSDKCTLIMVKATGLIVQRCFVPRHAFSPTTVAPTLVSSFYKSLSLPSFVLHVFLCYCKVTICSMRVVASVRDLWKSRANRGTAYAIHCLECYQSVRSSWKWYSDTLWSSDTPTILIIDWDAHLNNRTFCIFRNDWIDCRDAFHAVLCL